MCRIFVFTSRETQSGRQPGACRQGHGRIVGLAGRRVKSAGIDGWARKGAVHYNESRDLVSDAGERIREAEGKGTIERPEAILLPATFLTAHSLPAAASIDKLQSEMPTGGRKPSGVSRQPVCACAWVGYAITATSLLDQSCSLDLAEVLPHILQIVVRQHHGMPAVGLGNRHRRLSAAVACSQAESRSRCPVRRAVRKSCWSRNGYRNLSRNGSQCLSRSGSRYLSRSGSRNLSRSGSRNLSRNGSRCLSRNG
jgi:hypothetical protein